METTKTETYVVTVNSLGQRVFTSQKDPSKSFIIDEKGTLLEYEPNELSNIKLEAEMETNESEESNNLEDNSLGMINGLEGDFDNNLINELDSGIMNMVGDYSHFLMQHMNIQEPLTKLKTLIEQRLNVDLTGYKYYLQGLQELEGHKNLVDQCVQGEGLVQVNVQLLPHQKRINIIDVLKPAEDYVHEDGEENSEETTEDSGKMELAVPQKQQKIVQWQVDSSYKKDLERLNIPTDPRNWDRTHIHHWMTWAIKQFNLKDIDMPKWKINGEQLYRISLQDFQKMVPNDPGDIFWTHLELLRKMKVVAVMRDGPKEMQPNRRQPKIMEQNKVTKVKLDMSPYARNPESYNKSQIHNGQVQLWQFLLELLTTRDFRNVIHWIGDEGEFKLVNPEVVAKLWGERKNKPKMNYEKLSRALRYYYDGDMISKVHGKRFVYKFVCDLKQLLGYSAIELSNLVNYGHPNGYQG